MKEELTHMNLREFSEKVNFKRLMNLKGKNSQQDTNGIATHGRDDETNEGSQVECDEMPTRDDLRENAVAEKMSRVKWRCRDRTSGH
jgi:hypothetical protein